MEGGDAVFTVQGGTAFVRSEADWISVARISGDKKSSSFSVLCAKNTGERNANRVANALSQKRADAYSGFNDAAVHSACLSNAHMQGIITSLSDDMRSTPRAFIGRRIC